MLAASTLLTCGAVAPAAAEPAPSGSSRGATITVHRVVPVMQYRLDERASSAEDGQQDGGTVRMKYTCHRGDASAGEGLTAYLSTDFARGEHGLPCDGRRHDVELSIGRESDSPFTPQTRNLRTEVSVTFSIGISSIGGDMHVTAPMRVRFVGWDYDAEEWGSTERG